MRLFHDPYHGFAGPANTASTSKRYRPRIHPGPSSRSRNIEPLWSHGGSTEEAVQPQPQRASLTTKQLIRLYQDLNDQYVALTERELPTPISLNGWSAHDLRAYFNSDGQTLPRHLLSPRSPGEARGRTMTQRPPMDAVTAAVKLQSIFRGWMVRGSEVSATLKKRRLELNGIVCAAVEATNKFEPWVFDLELESKKVAGVPVPLIEYEETLLRQQLKLDGLQSCGPAADIMRHWRKQASCQLQERLNQVDTCREVWRRVQAQAASVA